MVAGTNIFLVRGSRCQNEDLTWTKYATQPCTYILSMETVRTRVHKLFQRRLRASTTSLPSIRLSRSLQKDRRSEG